MRIKALWAVLSCLLASCVTQDGAADKTAEAAILAMHLPPDYRKIIADDIKAWPDYAGIVIKDAQISNPAKEFGDILNGGTVVGICVRYLTRPRFLGQELAPRVITESISFTKGKQNNPGRKGRQEIAGLQCHEDRTYSPFREINTE
jgi:hypothetical protein